MKVPLVYSLVALFLLCLSLMAAQSDSAQRTANPAPSEAGVIPQNAQNKPLTTITGVVSDSFCPRYHYVLANSTPAECTRYCIAHGAQYIIKAGDKIYVLHDRPGHSLDVLSGKEAQVTGWLVDPSTIEVKSVAGKQ